MNYYFICYHVIMDFLGQILNFVRSKKVKILNFVRSKKVKILNFVRSKKSQNFDF